MNATTSKQPDTCYIVMECSGDYDEYREVPMKVFLDREKAEAFLSELENFATICNKIEDKSLIRRVEWNVLHPFPGGFYKAIGAYNAMRDEAYKEISDNLLIDYEKDLFFDQLKIKVYNHESDMNYIINECEIE
jgi:hypothetical protein